MTFTNKELTRKTIKTKINKLLSDFNYPIMALVLALSIGSIILFINPIIGLADNGEFEQIIESSGIYNLDINSDNIYNDYFVKEYGLYKYYNHAEGSYISTQNIFIGIGKILSKFFFRNSIMDIRLMSWIFLLVEAIGIYLIVKVFTSRLNNYKSKLIITITTIIIFCDIGYISYFNSFYSEAVNLSFLLLSIGLLLYSIQFQPNKIVFIFLFAITFFISVGTSKKLILFGIIAFVFLLRYSLIVHNNKKNGVAFLSGVFLISIFIMYNLFPTNMEYADRYHALNRGILLYANDSKDVMDYFGIDEQYEILKGTTFYDSVTLMNLHEESLWQDYYSKVTIPKILAYQITHPKVLFKEIKAAFYNSYSIRSESLGNYEKIANKDPGEKENKFSFYSTVKEKIFKGNIVLSFTVIIFFFFSFIFRYHKLKKKKEYKLMFQEEVFFLLFLLGISVIIVSVLKTGDADLSKSIFIYNVCFDLFLLHELSLIMWK